MNEIISRGVWDTVRPGPARPISPRGTSKQVVVHHTAGTYVYAAVGRPGAKWLRIRAKLSGTARRIVETWLKDDDVVKARECAELRAIKALHLRVPGLDNRDIAYHYAIFPSGRIYRLRDDTRLGSHTAGGNTRIGVVFPGNYEKHYMTDRQEDAYHWLLHHLGIREQDAVGHYRLNPTACPGKNIKRRLTV